MVEGEELREGGRQGVFSGRGCSCQGVIREAERQLSLGMCFVRLSMVIAEVRISGNDTNS